MVNYDVVAKTKRDRVEFVENYWGKAKTFKTSGRIFARPNHQVTVPLKGSRDREPPMVAEINAGRKHPRRGVPPSPPQSVFMRYRYGVYVGDFSAFFHLKRG